MYTSPHLVSYTLVVINRYVFQLSKCLDILQVANNVAIFQRNGRFVDCKKFTKVVTINLSLDSLGR